MKDQVNSEKRNLSQVFFRTGPVIIFWEGEITPIVSQNEKITALFFLAFGSRPKFVNTPNND